MNVTVQYHHEDGAWWAESPDVAGFTAAGDSYFEVRRQVFEGIPFHLDRTDVEISEQGAPGMSDWSVVFLGADVPQESIAELVRQRTAEGVAA